jgi:hypothetical protein
VHTPSRSCAAACLALLVATPARAQSLEDLLTRLFVVRGQTIPLQVRGQLEPEGSSSFLSEDDSFVPSAVQANAEALDLVTKWMSVSPAYFPFGSTSGGLAFRFERGIPAPAPTSAGPIFGERSQTLGRGRGVIGANVTSTRFTTSRGRPLSQLRLTFTHRNIDSDQCDAEEGRDCAPLGVPASENDMLEFLLNVDLSVDIGSVFLTYGLLDRVDLGIMLPFVHTSMDGRSTAQIIPFGTLPSGAAHFFAGTPEDPVLSSTQAVHGSATGIGDLAVRTKMNFLAGERAAVALLADVRFPTGEEDDFLGIGDWSARGIGVFSMVFGSFSPHLNAGYVWRGAKAGNGAAKDAVLVTIGFDQVFAPWATFATDLIAEFQVGKHAFVAPPPVRFTEPFERSVQPTSIGNLRNNVASASVGFRFATISNFTAVTNALFPVTYGSRPRTDFAWSLGLEYHF